LTADERKTSNVYPVACNCISTLEQLPAPQIELFCAFLIVWHCIAYID